jgi:Ca2+-binding EF-hand superfamily protein
MSKNKEDEFIELLSEQEICELHEAFNIFDVESDGSIDSKHLIILMNSLKQYTSQKELEKILNEFNLQLKKFKLKYDMK